MHGLGSFDDSAIVSSHVLQPVLGVVQGLVKVGKYDHFLERFGVGNELGELVKLWTAVTGSAVHIAEPLGHFWFVLFERRACVVDPIVHHVRYDCALSEFGYQSQHAGALGLLDVFRHVRVQRSLLASHGHGLDLCDKRRHLCVACVFPPGRLLRSRRVGCSRSLSLFSFSSPRSDRDHVYESLRLPLVKIDALALVGQSGVAAKVKLDSQIGLVVLYHGARDAPSLCAGKGHRSPGQVRLGIAHLVRLVAYYPLPLNRVQHRVHLGHRHRADDRDALLQSARIDIVGQVFSVQQVVFHANAVVIAWEIDRGSLQVKSLSSEIADG